MSVKQNIGYIGSKYSLLEFIETTISNYIDYNGKSFCDLFAGTNIVGRHFKNKCDIITNDLEYYSFVMSKSYISNKTIVIPNYLEHLNSLELEYGLFTQLYCKDRMYFSEFNGRKIDTIRQEIERLYFCEDIGEDEYYYYLTSLLEAADKVANTTSVYAAYLKKIKKTASNPLVLKELQIDSVGDNQSFMEDSNNLVKDISGDICYIDPPYNHRQYGSNYHILNTILRYDLNHFEPKGITGLRKYNKSDYCYVGKVLDTFEYLIKNLKFKYIFISYNNEGLMSLDEMKNTLSKYGSLHIHKKEYKTYKADSNRNNKSVEVEEYLLVLLK